LTPLKGVPLREVSVSAKVRVLAVNATQTDVLRYLQERGILPGCELTVVEAAPMEGPLTLQVGDKDTALGLQISEFVIVEVK
jgi:DtxR family Mn-dependent transcriptional regulator